MFKNHQTNAIDEAATAGRSRKTYFSFGDEEGLTATVGASGRLLRISRHFSSMRTGFVVDNPDIPEPYYVDDRLEKLLEMADDPSGKEGIGLSLDVLPNRREFVTETSFVNNRWPTFRRTTTDGFEFELQYVACSGTIYQMCKFKGVPESSRAADSGPPLVFRISSDILIRSLEFSDRKNKFNKARADDGAYRTRPQESNNFIIREHRCCDKQHENSDENCHGTMKTVLRIDVLDEDGGQEELLFTTGRPTEPHEFKIERKTTTSMRGITAFVLAYTLSHVSQNGNDIPRPMESLETINQMLEPRPQSNIFIDHPLEFFLSRNLEHVLSVCSIPVSSTKDWKDPAIALTCGDVDGHHVAPAASFYASQLLLQVLKDLKPQHHPACMDCQKPASQQPYICETKRRIERVLNGHLRWLLLETKDPFCPNVWVNGEKIDGWEDNIWLAPKSLTDAPFRLITSAEICNSLDDLYNFTSQKPRIDENARAWIRDLGEVNKLGKYAFPRCDDAEYRRLRTNRYFRNLWGDVDREILNENYPEGITQDFDLADHALIWQAIKAVEEMGVAQAPKDSDNRLYSSTHIQPIILKRFTTENPYDHQRRTIAVARSPTRNRFFFRSKDTVLLRAMGQGFFDQTGPEHDDSTRNWVEVWENTMECQANHEDNDDTSWDNPRRFILSIMMGWYGKRMNERPPEGMRKHAISVLLKSSSANGLFPGMLSTDGERYKPVKYKDEPERYNYWGTTFEIPYVLWKYGLESKHLAAGDAKNASPSKTKGEVHITDRLDSLSGSVDQVYLLLKEAPRKQAVREGPESTPGQPMKHNLPLTNAVNASNIVEMKDEWLYQQPDFFRRGGEATDSENREETMPEVEAEVNQGATSVTRPERQQRQNIKSHEQHGPSFAFLLDHKKSRFAKGDSQAETIRLAKMSSEQIKLEMTGGRTAQNAKKRFWAFFSACPAANEVCLHTVSKAEKRETRALENFLEKHKSYDKFFTDETAAIYNTWTTELHLSFYNIGAKSEGGDLMLLPSIRTEALTLPAVGSGGERQPLTRVVMSFRFEGDFFNRYWTCRYLEANEARTKLPVNHSTTRPGKGSIIRSLFFQFFPVFRNKSRGTPDGMEAWIDTPSAETDVPRNAQAVDDEDYEQDWKKGLDGLLREANMGNSNITPWKQRRVLELLLFGRIVEEMTTQASLIIDEVLRRLRTHRPDTSRSDAHRSIILGKRLRPTRIQAEQIQHVLQTVEEDINENIAEIDLWEKRETDRQAERPRWTLHDESRYRVILQKLQNSNDRKVETLRRTRTKITKLKESLEKKLDHRRAEDIEIFTYVTVIFLPLGFGTSIFSMSDVPEGRVVWNVAIAAVVALFTTILLLVVAMYVGKHLSALTAAASRVGQMFPWRNGKPQGDEEAAGNS